MTDQKPTYFRQQEDEFIPINVAEPRQKVSLSKATREHIDKWAERYPQDNKMSAVFEALRVVQEENGGYLSTALMEAVADHLNMTNIAVFEVAAFYTLYHLNPVGKHVINVCTNVSCQLNGADELVAHLKKRLQVEMNATTTDGQFTLREVECLGACIAPPVCQIGKHYIENMTIEKMDQLLDAYLTARGQTDGK